MLHYSYDDEADKVNQYQRLNLEGLEKIEIGKDGAMIHRNEQEERNLGSSVLETRAFRPRHKIFCYGFIFRTIDTAITTLPPVFPCRPRAHSVWEAEVLLYAPALQERRDKWVLPHTEGSHTEP